MGGPPAAGALHERALPVRASAGVRPEPWRGTRRPARAGGGSKIRAPRRALLGRPAPPEETGPACVYFASEAESSYVTGEVLTRLGGETTAG
jgi:NAD(P)-dependent dehydrogenase (short-subunit alcohol dehydrogenase family)